MLEKAVESTQRSIDEPDGGRVDEELNLSLQTHSPNQQIVEAVIEKKPDNVPDSLDDQGYFKLVFTIISLSQNDPFKY